MFPRFAAKGPGALLGLLAVLWPAGASARPMQTPQRSASVTATSISRVRPAKAAIPIVKPAPKTIKASTTPVKSVKGILKPTVVDTSAVMAKRNHGGGQYDHNQDMGENNPAIEDPRFRVSNEIEPAFLVGFPRYVLSTDRGHVTSGLLHAYDNYPAGPNEPQFLVGPDFHINLSTARNGIITDPDRNPLNLEPDASGKDRGEQFEPALTQPFGTNDYINQRLAFSAFLPGSDDTDAYKMSGDFTHSGMPVRVIRISDDVFTPTTSIETTLRANAYTSFTSNAETTGVYTPDASPDWYPVDHNQIVFSSLRGYNKDDASTHYASIYVWTPSTLSTEQPRPSLLIGQNYSFPGPDGTPIFPFKNKSLLYPRFSPDGRYLSFTVADVQYEPTDDVGHLPDIVWDIDVTKAALNNPKNAVFVKSARVWVTEPVNFGSLRMPDPLRETDKLQPIQVTTFKDAAGNAPRDMMSFWSSQGQLGFSSDRKDTTGSGLADSVETDATKALFDIYTFPFPFTPNQIESAAMKDLAPKRATLGANPLVDDSNELKGSWGPVNPLSTGNDVLAPNILYQADDTSQADPTTGATYRDWDVWLTDKTQTATYTKSLLIGVPVITRDDTLSPKDVDNLKRTHRAAFPNDYVGISVQVNPNQLTYGNDGKVNTRVYVDVKDANQVKWDQLTDVLDPNISSVNWHETSYWPVKIDGSDAAAYETKYGGQADAPRLGSRIQLDADSAKGVGWFTAKWYTPVTASDYIVDVRVVTPTDVSYSADNIAGFSTVPFVATAKALLVSDFMAGQKAIAAASGTSTTAGEQTESYVTYRPHNDTAWSGTDVRRVIFSYGNGEWNTLGPLLEYQSASVVTDPGSKITYVVPGPLSTTNPLVDNPSGFNNVYNIWRVQCREPITMDDVKDAQGNVLQYGVLRDFLPYNVTQPGLPTSAQIPRTQVVNDRCVLWFAPHAGQLNGNAGENSRQGYLGNQGVGTVARLETQAEIVKYINAGGRIWLSGDDVANIVSATGSVTSPALLKAFKVKFHSHYAFDAVGVYAHNRQDLKSNAPGDTSNSVIYKTWEHHPSNEPNPTGDSGAELWLAPFDDGQGWHPPHSIDPYYTGDDGAWTNLYIDAVVKDSTASNTLTILDFLVPGQTPPESLPDVGTPVAGVQYEQVYDPSKLNTSPSKTLFFSVGMEGLHRKYDGPRSDQLFHAKNPLAQMVHNAIDFMTTGGFVGHVTLTNNVTPVKDVLVWVVDRWNYISNGVIKGTARTDDAGAYQIDGLDSSNYQLYVYKTGYAGQNPNYYDIDSGWRTQDLAPGYSEANLLIYPVAPGTLKGSVVDKANTSLKLAGVTVHVTDIQLTVDRTVVSDATGNYEFDNLPAGL
ncbi:MAG TPA: carboxypeptidase-like regulatory domain-containing protein, partial [Armatimonadota bacterium]